MNFYQTTISYEGTPNFKSVINIQANGKEEAIDKALEIIFKKDFQRYMQITTVDVIDNGSIS